MSYLVVAMNDVVDEEDGGVDDVFASERAGERKHCAVGCVDECDCVELQAEGGQPALGGVDISQRGAETEGNGARAGDEGAAESVSTTRMDLQN